MITTTQCQHCGGAIEFELDNWQPGAAGDCPHCNAETALRRMEIYEAPKNVPKNRSQISKPPVVKKWKPVGAGAEVLFLLLGFLLIAIAAFVGSTGNIVLACQIAGGSFIWFGFAFVLGHLRNIAEKPRE